MRALREGTYADAVAIVTGGGTGLGLAVSRGLLQLGARKVVVASRDRAHHERILAEGDALGGKVLSHALDVREPTQVDELFRAVAEREGRLDLVVNNAAGNFVMPSLRMKPKAWRAVIDIALSGTFYGCQAAARAMQRIGSRGAIVNVAATYAWTGAPGVVHSAAAKAGVVALTRTLAVEWAPLGLRVNAIAPGPFHSDGAERNLWPDEETRRRLLDTIPTCRFADVEEVAESLLWLGAPCNASLTGEILVVDGGQWLKRGLFGSGPDGAAAR